MKPRGDRECGRVSVFRVDGKFSMPSASPSFPESLYGSYFLRKASPYLPSYIAVTDEGRLQPPPAVASSFGLVENQTRIEMNMFDTHKVGMYTQGSPCFPFIGIYLCQLNLFQRANHTFSMPVPPCGVSTGVQSIPQIGFV